MHNDAWLPSYERLFGDLDLREGDPARTVYSPAAYLTDLLNLLRDAFDDPSIVLRRPDIGRVPLDAEHTFPPVPYLDIVVRVLEELVGPKPYETLAALTHPLALPFSLESARVATYLRHLGVDPVEFRRLFATHVDPDLIVRAYLALSPRDVEVITTPRADEAGIAALYGRPPADLADVETFLAATSMTGAELRELLYQDPLLERSPETFFVHAGGPVVRVDDDDRTLITAGGGAIPAAWFDRANRFVRLARRTGLSFTDLDLVLTSCRLTELNTSALRAIAAAVSLHRDHDVPFEVVAALTGRTLPVSVNDVPPPSGDLLAPQNRGYRLHLALALDLAEPDLAAIVTHFRDRYDGPLVESPFDHGTDVRALSLLHRAGRLAATLAVSVAELFVLLNALEADPVLRRYTTFPVLPVVEPGTGDCHRVLEGDDPVAALWLAQTLCAVAAWMREAGFGVEELAEILGEPATAEAEQERLDVLTEIGDRFAEVAFGPDTLLSDRFDERDAQVAHDVLAAYEDGVVSPRDRRLLRLDPATVRIAGYAAVSDLAVLSREDFQGIGLDTRLAQKIFTNLALFGLLHADGLLADGPLPAELILAGEFADLSAGVFDALAAADGVFYPSDVADLLPDLDGADQEELYDNLLYNGHLDEDGQILDPDFFADPDNAGLFTASADLSDVAAGALAALRERADGFAADDLALDPGVFDRLRLSEAQLAALLGSLRFNGVLDRDDVYADHLALLALPLDDLAVPLELYPVRGAVLAAMREQIAIARDEAYTFVPDDFAKVADEAMARRVADRLDGEVTVDGRVREDVRGLFEAAEGGLDLGDGFTPADGELVYRRIAGMLAAQRPYRLDLGALTELGFTGDERDALVAFLVTAGDLDEAFGVPWERLAYFGTVTNALDFTLPGAEDYSKDVFFLLHAVAKEIVSAVGEIADVLAETATAQRETLTAVLRDAFGVPAAVIEAVCAAVAPDPLGLFVPPALAARSGDPALRRGYRRIRRFARLAAKLGLDAAEVAVVFADQDLAGKFPEPLALPPGADRFDALLSGGDGLIYAFAGTSYWTYSATTYALSDPLPKPLITLSPNLAGLAAVDAAFVQADGSEWIVGRGVDGGSRAFTRVPGGTRWGAREQVWGKVRNNFTDPKRIDGAYVDADGRTYLFSGDQYLRYSGDDFAVADEGYPRAIEEWWEGEGHGTALPPAFTTAVDAAFHGADGRTHVFSGDRWFDGTTEGPLAARWGRVRNTFEHAERVDAAYADGQGFLLFRGDQVARYADSPENDGVRVADGYPRRIEEWRRDVPAEFEGAVEAAFQDRSGVVHLFKDGKTVALAPAGPGLVTPTAERWGKLAPVLPGGTVDAAFLGRDGHTYLFSGDRYLRYSTADYSVADPGYPRGVGGDWGGLDRVDAAFVLDDATHLFGPVGQILDLPADYEAGLAGGRLSVALRRRLREHGVMVAEDAPVTGAAPRWQVTAEGPIVLTIRRAGDRIKVSGDDTIFHVRYSSRDYTVPDAGYPMPLASNWWNLPVTLAADPGFARIDAVFTGRDNQTYLFSGDRFVVFDARHRWWSEPYALRERWDSIPFDRVDAAFVGKDGKTYVFGGDRFVRYSTADYTRVDDRFPAMTGAFWGNVVNTIGRTGRVDATLVLDAVESVDGVEVPRTYTYLFSGGQYVRYLGDDFSVVQNGYPRPITELRGEPRMAALSVRLDGVDAAFADRRNVYLFRGGQWHVVSDALYRKYDDLDLAGVRCAFVEDGAVLVERDGGWTRHSPLEGPASAVPARPRVLRTVPAEYRSGLDAVLTGADGTTYLFKGPNCFNTAINHDYPLTEEWGRPRNTIYQDNVVDAAFVGRDGRTYLFSGDQFVVYTDSFDTIDGEPHLISEHWGLASVTLAYLRNGVTHLFEHPGADGRMRHLVYTGEHGPYLQPDPGYPALTDETFWKAPDGFPVPSAVLFEGDTMLLLNGERCVQFSEDSGQWSYPRPIERIWRGFGHGLEPGDTLRAAFTGPDGATYFFFAGQYARYAERAFAAPAPIRQRWGRAVNPFVPEDGTGRIDAAIVFGDDTTYLFSGRRYVRYTGPEYRYTDPGYPKLIAGNLRAEPAFANLAETFEDAVAGRGLDTAVANDRSAYLVAGGALHVVSRTAQATYDLALLGRVRNAISDRRRVDAALVRDQHTFLFSGDQYVRYTGGDYDHVDDGYPRPIEALPAELGLAALPADFADGLDAAFRTRDGRVYLFKGARFLAGDAVHALKDQWGRIRNTFAATPGIDAAFTTSDGTLYAFRADQYIRYLPGALDLVEPGYPRTIKDDWGALPAPFEAGIDGAFTLEGRTYLVKGEQYVRYSGAYDELDRTFPQPFRHRWSDLADYRLTDVHTIARFAELSHARPGLTAVLAGGAADPYERLAGLFGWDVEELRWVKRNAGLITEFSAEEERFEIEFVLKLVRLFAVAGKMGTVPSRLYTAGSQADALALLLESAHSPADWAVAGPAVHNELNVLKRDALVPAVLHLNPAVADARALYELVLADVEMGPEGKTSPVREAIAATQLFIHRYLLDLEQVALQPDQDEQQVRRGIRTWWTWLKDYRIWEANRKVFLYPENYLRPELRDTKTPAFRELENDLLQGEITAETAQRAYKRYLDEYTEVSRLAVSGAYVYAEDGAAQGVRRLVLFGRTRTEPRRHYYRAAEFRDGDRLSVTWEPWVKVDVQIDADRVDPVHAFGRVFAFWSVVETVAPDISGATTIVAHKDGDRQDVAAPPPKYRVRVFYSFYNLNKEWVPAQQLPPGAPQDGPVSDVHLFVQASATLPGGDQGVHDSIVVSCSYTVAKPTGKVRESAAYALTPELYAVPVAAAVEPARLVEPAKIFDEAGAPVNPAGVVRFNSPANSSDGPWFSVDHKGGSFLCRPITVDPGGDPPVLDLKGNAARLPAWERIDAAAELPDGSRYFFDSRAGEFLEVRTKGKLRSGNGRTAARWGVIGNALTRTGVVDALLVRGAYTYVFSGAEYYRYQGGPFGPLDAGYPLPIATNTENLPRWNRIEVAFTDPGGAEYFYAREHGVLGPKGNRWADLPRTELDTVLLRDGKLYVFSGERYVRYSGDRPDPGYPKQLATNDDGLPRWRQMGAALGYHDSAYFFDNTNGTYIAWGPGERGPAQQTRDLGRIPTAITRTGAVDAAYLAADRLYLTSGTEYVRYTLSADGSAPDFVDEGYPKPLARRVQGVFRRGESRYVFSGGKYALLGPGQDLDALATAAFHDIAGSWHSLPADFAHRFTGMLDADGALLVFLTGQYVSYGKDTAVPRPYEFAALPHEIVRLTSSTAFELNRRLLVGGVPALLAPEAQETDELPAFSRTESGPTTIKVTDAVAGLPASSHLDFQSANGRYYWEIFFHAPLLIAQALNTAQRFADARTWYEFVFDPSEQGRYWRFLPFLAVDVRALVTACRADLYELGHPNVVTAFGELLAQAEAAAPAFDQERPLTTAETTLLDGLAAGLLNPADDLLAELPGNAVARGLREKIAMLTRLRRQYDLMGDHGALLKAYLEDPFDPHAIAALRPAAYRRAVVMAYIDNLLDWGDMLFLQYTMESIDEARMLYVLAYDLLGRRPEGVGTRTLPAVHTYNELCAGEWGSDPYAARITAGGRLLEGLGAVHGGLAHPYYDIPGNSVLGDYWSRVEDRLRKIRASLDIMGVSRPLPLFEPPADVMALVRGAAAGLTPGQSVAGLGGAVPHQRFAVVLRRANELTDALRQFGGDLVSVLERRDGEELTLLRARQDAAIQVLTRKVKQAQVDAATENLQQVRIALESAGARVTYYQDMIAAGISPLQQAQLAMMASAALAHFTGSGLKIGAAVAFAVPQTLIGPFIMGTEVGGEQVGEALDKSAEVAESLGEGFSVMGELLGVRADQERQEDDWRYQLMLARSDVAEITHQVAASGHQLDLARRDLEVTEAEIANAEAVTTFLTGKFSDVELYQWMSGRLAVLYRRSYDLAYQTAKAAERAYQYERGANDAYIQPAYWESRRAGLMAGEALNVDLARLGAAYADGDARGLEIVKRVSLLGLDPLAALRLRTEGRCEFTFTEALFDRDFPGHYRRRIRTLSLTFEGPGGPLAVNATLTQSGHKTVLTADPRAVRHLLDGRGDPPESIRSDWRPSQQIALSDLEEGRDNNGLFELRFDDDRYLPFEGTGAVSTWRLEATGPLPADLLDVTIVVKYVADQGGAVFANAVRGMLKPYPTARYLDVAAVFPDSWEAFLDGGDLTLPLTPEMFPRMNGRQITTLCATYQKDGPGSVRLLLGGDRRTALEEGRLVPTPGLTAGPLTLVADGDPAALTGVGLIIGYRAG